MAEVHMQIGGGGGGSYSDDCTAISPEVLEGRTAITNDSNDEPQEGTMKNHGTVIQTLGAGETYSGDSGYYNSIRIKSEPLAGQTDGTAVASDIFYGKTAYVKGTKLTGTMPNCGNVSVTLQSGDTYTIPEGYHAGSGTVTVSSLASQTSGNATAAQILYGRTAVVNGTTITGSMPNRGAVNGTVALGSSYPIPEGYHNGSGRITGPSVGGNANAGEILSGKTAWVNNQQISGTMTNHGATVGSVNCGGTYYIPAGYHNGQGYIVGNSLAAQTGATA